MPYTVRTCVQSSPHPKQTSSQDACGWLTTPPLPNYRVTTWECWGHIGVDVEEGGGGRIMRRNTHASTSPSCHSPMSTTLPLDLLWICVEATRNECCSATMMGGPFEQHLQCDWLCAEGLKPRLPQLWHVLMVLFAIPVSSLCLSSRLPIQDYYQTLRPFLIPSNVFTAGTPHKANMKLSLLALAAVASLASGQCVSSIPECAQDCLMTAAASVGCGETDYACQCTSQHQTDITNNATTCVLAACGQQIALSRYPLMDQIMLQSRIIKAHIY